VNIAFYKAGIFAILQLKSLSDTGSWLGRRSRVRNPKQDAESPVE
jgi:hypothetical protein